jgi:hypothetical protein
MLSEGEKLRRFSRRLETPAIAILRTSIWWAPVDTLVEQEPTSRRFEHDCTFHFVDIRLWPYQSARADIIRHLRMRLEAVLERTQKRKIRPARDMIAVCIGPDARMAVSAHLPTSKYDHGRKDPRN